MTDTPTADDTAAPLKAVTLTDNQRMIVYQENVATFRSLNQLMWQIPLIAMTLTGGLWFGVSRPETSPLFQVCLLGLAAAGNLVLIAILARLRYIMGEYLRWQNGFYPAGFVAAEGKKRFEKPKTVRTMFQSMLWLAFGVSLILMVMTAIQAKLFSGDSAEARAVAFYDRNASELADRYEGLDFAATHPQLALALQNSSPQRVLDVGAGSGRDAAAMASLGHLVTAVEPSTQMRFLAKRLHPTARVDWRDAALPDLSGFPQAQGFDVILLSAVWMHVEPEDREAAFARLAELLAPGGRIYMTLRFGPADAERAIFPVSFSEVDHLAREHGLAVTNLGQREDLLGRGAVSWTSVMITSVPSSVSPPTGRSAG